LLPRDYLKRINLGVLLPALILSAAGLFTMYGIAWKLGERTGDLFFFTHQLMWVGFALAAGFLATLLDYKLWSRSSWSLYLVNIALLVVLLFFGRRTHGAESWFNIGGMKFQPSEIAKMLFIITFADFLAKSHDALDTWSVLGLAFVQFLVPFGLIMLQPDMGTGLVFVVVFYSMMFAAGVDWMRLLASVVMFASMGVAASPFLIKGYQMQRLTSFINPYSDPRGAGYQLLQSKAAIGSGGLIGKGFTHATQGSLGFLPAAHTDFIFASVSEQWGLIGAGAILLLFLVLLFRILRVALDAEDLFGVYIVAGVFAMLSFQILVNIGMSVGVFPITGIPLPFVSYGGSSILTNCLCVGLILNISFRRRKIMFF
jgi:rod shape determining protein RodA